MVNIQELETLNNKWKELITNSFSATPWESLEKRYKEGKDAILNDQILTSFKDKTVSEQLEMLSSVEGLYRDGSMTYAGNSITQNRVDLIPIFWEYKDKFLKMMDEERDKSTKKDLKVNLPSDQDQIDLLKQNISQLNGWLVAKDKTIIDREDTANRLYGENSKLQTDLSIEENKNAKAKGQLDKLLEKKKENLKKELTNFYVELDVDDDEIAEKYDGKNYKKIIDDQLTFDNEESMKNAFQAVACIITTKKVEQMSEVFDKDSSLFSVEDLLKAIMQVGEAWAKTGEVIEEEDNPFYSDIIKKELTECRGKIEQLKTKHENKGTEPSQRRTGKTRGLSLSGPLITLDSLPQEALQWTILRVCEKTSNVKTSAKIIQHLDLLGKEYPSVEGEIRRIKGERQTEWDDLVKKESKNPLFSFSSVSSKDWSIYLRFFANDVKIKKNIKAEIKNGDKIKNLFSISNSGTNNLSDRDKLLRNLKSDFKGVKLADTLSSHLQNDIYAANAIAFTVELYKSFYLELLPKYIEDKLEEKNDALGDDNIKLSVDDLVDEKSKWNADWEGIRQKIFTHLHSSLTRTIEVDDFKQLLKNLNYDIDTDLRGLIKKIRDEKKGFICNVPGHDKIEQKTDLIMKFIFDSQADQVDGVTPLEKIKNYLTKTKGEWNKSLVLEKDIEKKNYPNYNEAVLGEILVQQEKVILALQIKSFADELNKGNQKIENLIIEIEKALSVNTIEAYGALLKYWDEEIKIDFKGTKDKLRNLLNEEKDSNYQKLVKNNPELVTGNEIDQGKIKKFKDEKDNLKELIKTQNGETIGKELLEIWEAQIEVQK